VGAHIETKQVQVITRVCSIQKVRREWYVLPDVLGRMWCRNVGKNIPSYAGSHPRSDNVGGSFLDYQVG